MTPAKRRRVTAQSRTPAGAGPGPAAHSIPLTDVPASRGPAPHRRPVVDLGTALLTGAEHNPGSACRIRYRRSNAVSSADSGAVPRSGAISASSREVGVREFHGGAVRLNILHHAAEREIHGAWMTKEPARMATTSVRDAVPDVHRPGKGRSAPVMSVGDAGMSQPGRPPGPPH